MLKALKWAQVLYHKVLREGILGLLKRICCSIAWMTEWMCFICMGRRWRQDALLEDSKVMEAVFCEQYSAGKCSIPV